MVLERCGPIEQEPLKLLEAPRPEPGSGQVLIRVQARGICHTDLHSIEAEIATPRLPLIPGHQIVGSVERVGAGVSKWKPGDRVGVPWLKSRCGSGLSGLKAMGQKSAKNGPHLS